jgi:hypothetical protein
VLCCALQLEESEGKPDAAGAVYGSGLKRCPDCVAMWRAAARLEEAQGNTGRARALLEQVGVGVEGWRRAGVWGSRHRVSSTSNAAAAAL